MLSAPQPLLPAHRQVSPLRSKVRDVDDSSVAAPRPNVVYSAWSSSRRTRRHPVCGASMGGSWWASHAARAWSGGSVPRSAPAGASSAVSGKGEPPQLAIGVVSGGPEVTSEPDDPHAAAAPARTATTDITRTSRRRMATTLDRAHDPPAVRQRVVHPAAGARTCQTGQTGQTGPAPTLAVGVKVTGIDS